MGQQLDNAMGGNPNPGQRRDSSPERRGFNQGRRDSSPERRGFNQGRRDS